MSHCVPPLAGLLIPKVPRRQVMALRTLARIRHATPSPSPSPARKPRAEPAVRADYACVAAAPSTPRALREPSELGRAPGAGPCPPRGLASSCRPLVFWGGTTLRPLTCSGFLRTTGTTVGPEQPSAGLGRRRPRTPAAAWARRGDPRPGPRAGRGLHIRPHPPGASPPGAQPGS
jgi:hypothetical protein